MPQQRFDKDPTLIPTYGLKGRRSVKHDFGERVKGWTHVDDMESL